MSEENLREKDQNQSDERNSTAEKNLEPLTLDIPGNVENKKSDSHLISSSTLEIESPLLKLYRKPKITCTANIDGFRPAGTCLYFRFTVITSNEKYPKPSVSNERSYQEFCSLCAFLERTYIANIVPILPPPLPFSRLNEPGVAQSFQKFLIRILSHPVFSNDQSTINFFCSSATFAPFCTTKPFIVIPNQSLSSRLLSFIQTKHSEPNPFFTEKEERNNERLFIFKNLEVSFKNFSKSKKLIAEGLIELSSNLSELAKSQNDEGLTLILNDFGSKMNVISDVQKDMGTRIESMTNEMIQNLINRFKNTGLVLKNRCKVIEAKNKAQAAVLDQRRKLEKIKAVPTISPVHVDTALAKYEELLENQKLWENQAVLFSTVLVKDLCVTETHYEEDFKNFMHSLAMCETVGQRRILNDGWLAAHEKNKI